MSQIGVKHRNLKLALSLALRFAPLIYIALGTMISIYSVSIPFIDWVRLITSAWGVTGVFIYVCNGTQLNLIKQLSLFVIAIIPPTILYYFVLHSPTPHSVLDVGDSMLWVSIFFIFFRQGYRYPQTMYFAKNIAFLIPIFAIVFYHVRMFLIFNEEDTAMVSTAYYSLFLMPFAVLLNNKKLRVILLLVILATILLSSKRAGLIAFFLSAIVYIVSEMKNSKKHHSIFAIVFMIATGLLVLAGFMLYFIEENDLIILDRLSRLSEDGGSGRSDIYSLTWNMILNSDLIEIIFGHGFNTVHNDSILKLSAHTDTLEVLYDYGIVGSIIYLIIIYSIFSYSKKVKKIIPAIYPAYMTSLVLFLVISIFSHLVIYPTYFLFICAFWGIAIGQCEKTRRLQYGR